MAQEGNNGASRLFDLHGRVALIVGGSRNIGLAIAEGLAGCGSAVVLASRTRAEVQAAAAALRHRGAKAAGLVADITSPRGVERLAVRAEEQFGPIDILVNNAGTIVRKGVLEIAEADVQRMIATNLVGVFRCCQAVGREMVRRRRGKIINITSIAAILALKNRAVYNMTKAGVAQLTKCLALEWAPWNVQVNAIGPGIIQTSLNREYLVRHGAKRRLMEHKIPLGRLGRPTDLVGAAVFLAAPASDYLTGQTLYVDGGWMIGDVDW